MNYLDRGEWLRRRGLLGSEVEMNPHAKAHQHLKIVLNLNGELEKIQIYGDAQGNKKEILSVYEELKEEIVKFCEKTSEIMADQLINNIRASKRKFDPDRTVDEFVDELCDVFEED